jgi:hypothetical protein
MSKAATTEALQELHDHVAKALTKIMKNGRTEKRRIGEAEVEITTEASAADIAAAINFLARNKIECAPGQAERGREGSQRPCRSRRTRAVTTTSRARTH